ncbi:GyrI-like domain-containing protein [Nocardia miyunensis]|uniref:GyrI-like domain-containing protein n=1 Tax=Nocardia miyunensis TaxID=282684 RepID=UPI000831137A|nr:GyrI-like domain-containing protein [Nocardia miyunensis]
MEYRVDVYETVPQTMLRLPWQLRPDRLGTDVDAGMRELTTATERAGLIACGAPTITYREDAEPDGNIRIDFAVPVDLGTKLGIRSGAEVIAQPGSLVARTCHRGGYDSLDTAYRALHEWIRESGYRSAGPPTEVYLIAPDEMSDPRRLFTEIRIPVTPVPVLTAHVDRPFDETAEYIRKALERHGFEIVGETDLQALVRNRLGAHIDDYLVFSACHPLLMARAIAADPQAAWLSSAFVVVRADSTGTLVEAGDPTALPQILDGTALSEIARELRHLLVDALDVLCSRQVR